MNQVLFTLPVEGNNCGVLSCVNNVLANTMRKRGWQVDVTDPRDDDFLFKILSVGQKEEAILFFGHFFFDLRVSAQNHFKEASIADFVRCRIAIKVGDHPFSKFMWERIRNIHKRSFVFAAEPDFADAARYLQPELKHFHAIPPPITYAHARQVPAFEDRPIDLLVPITVDLGPSIEKVLATFPKGSDLQKLAEATYESMRGNRTEYPLTIVRRLTRELFSGELPTQANQQQTLLSIFEMLHNVDHCVRVERRIDFLTHLLGDTNGKRVVVLDRGFPEFLKSSDIEVRPPVDALQLGQLMGQSKLVAHCHPTYPNGLHERIINGMASGCVVISDFAPSLEQSFQNRGEMVWIHSSMALNEVLAEVGETKLPAIATNAHQRVWADFTPEKHIDQILDAMSFPKEN